MSHREDILSEFAMEETITPALLKTYLTRHPNYADDLLELYNELVMSDLEIEQAQLPLETKAMTSAPLNVAQVESALFGAGVRDLSARLSLPRSFFIGLQANVVRIGSLPGPFLKRLASEIGVRTQDVVMGMQRGGNQAFALKSDSKLRVDEPIGFDDYVAHAGLTDEQRSALDEMTSDDGPG